MSWSFRNGSQFMIDATAYINGAALGGQAFAFNAQSRSSDLQAINQAGISNPRRPFPV